MSLRDRKHRMLEGGAEAEDVELLVGTKIVPKKRDMRSRPAREVLALRMLGEEPTVYG